MILLVVLVAVFVLTVEVKKSKKKNEPTVVISAVDGGCIMCVYDAFFYSSHSACSCWSIKSTSKRDNHRVLTVAINTVR